MITDTAEQVSLFSSGLDELESLLAGQIAAAKQGNMNEVGILNARADVVVEQLIRAGVLASAEFQRRQERLQKLYDDLQMVLSAQKSETAENLSRIHKGRQTIEVYRSSV